MKNLNECKIKDFDDIFYATKDSQGYTNTVLAIKYVLFNDETVFDDGKVPEGNKYLYISSTNNARKKAMLLQNDDLAHITVKYCMASFGLRGKGFTFTDDEFILDKKRIERLEVTPYEMIERVAYAAVSDPYEAYIFLFTNKKLLSSVVEYMIEERYISELKDAIDNFSGIIDNQNIPSDDRFRFYDAYQNLDDNFEEIKRNDPNYIK